MSTNNYFVRIDSRLSEEKVSSEIFNAHLDYLKGISLERPFAGGGFKLRDGGMIIFQAEDVEDAKRIADNDPLIRAGFYRYELLQWEIVIGSFPGIEE